MNDTTFIPYQRLELQSMSTEQLLNIIRIAATNYHDTSLILTPRIDQSGQAYYWTGLPLFPHKGQGRSRRCRKLHTGQQDDTGHRLASIPPVQAFGILSRCPRLHQNEQRQDIPEQETDIPTRKHSLFARNQGCVFDRTTISMQQK